MNLSRKALLDEVLYWQRWWKFHLASCLASWSNFTEWKLEASFSSALRSAYVANIWLMPLHQLSQVCHSENVQDSTGWCLVAVFTFIVPVHAHASPTGTILTNSSADMNWLLKRSSELVYRYARCTVFRLKTRAYQRSVLKMRNLLIDI